jgi:hypothetical protein
MSNLFFAEATVTQSGENWLSSAPWVRERFVHTGGQSPEETAGELHRFFLLTKLTNEPIAMVGGNIDKMWHRLIEFTEFYTDFCKSTYGEVIHHRSRTASSPVPDQAVRNFFQMYEREYGAVPEIWFVGTPQALIDYGTGKIDVLPSAAQWSGWPGRQGSRM